MRPRSELLLFRFAGARGRVNQDHSQRKHESRIPWRRLMFMTNINRKRNATFLKATTCNVKHVISHGRTQARGARRADNTEI